VDGSDHRAAALPLVLRAALPRLLGFHRRVGLLDDRDIMAAFRDLYGDSDIGDLPVPLFLAATDMETGERVVISDGPVVDAVRASIAIPVLLRPWPVGGRLLVDGGASDPLPISVAIREGSDIIVAMGFENTYDARLDSLSRLINQHLMITVNHLLRSTFAFYSMVHHAEVIPVMPVFDRPIALSDVARFPYIVEQGVAAAEEQVGYLKRLLSAA
jgi:NTE family protein